MLPIYATDQWTYLTTFELILRAILLIIKWGNNKADLKIVFKNKTAKVFLLSIQSTAALNGLNHARHTAAHFSFHILLKLYICISPKVQFCKLGLLLCHEYGMV